MEPTIRWWLYLFGFAAILLWETVWPRKTLVSPTAKRWTGQLLMMILASFLTLLVIPVSSIEVAFRTDAAHWGLLPNSGLPYWLQCAIGVLTLDFVRFSQHYCFHASPLLWRIHRIHHSDPDFDLTTGIRFHPFDPILSIATYIPVVWLLGVPPLAAMGYEIAHVIHAFFSHANIVLPERIDRYLRTFLVTPETHRIHHSDQYEENRHNYGEMFTLWDHLLGTYQAQPKGGHQAMGIGLTGYTNSQMWNPIRLLLWPLFETAVRPDKDLAAKSGTDPVPSRAAELI